VAVEAEDQRVQAVADVGQPLGVLDHAVELVAVDDQEPLAVGGAVFGLAADGDAAEVQPGVLPRRLVVVAGHVDHPRALARLAQHLLHHVVVALLPVPRLLQLPAVDDVADQVQGVGLVVAQEVEQEGGLAAGGAEVDIGNPDGAVALVHRVLRRGADAPMVAQRCDRRMWRR